jgi:hypothetical protein
MGPRDLRTKRMQVAAVLMLGNDTVKELKELELSFKTSLKYLHKHE